MAVEYKLIPKRNPQDPEAEPKYYATPVYHKTITMEELAREVSARFTTTSEGDVYSVLVDVRDIIRARSYVPATSAASIPKPGNLYPMPSANRPRDLGCSCQEARQPVPHILGCPYPRPRQTVPPPHRTSCPTPSAARGYDFGRPYPIPSAAWE